MNDHITVPSAGEPALSLSKGDSGVGMTIPCACETKGCPASIELIPNGLFVRLKTCVGPAAFTTAIDARGAVKTIEFLADHFGISLTITPPFKAEPQENHP